MYNWLPRFIKNGGFDTLFRLLISFTKRISQPEKKKEFLQSKVQKEGLKILIKIMKNILIASFCATSENSE